MSPFFCNAAVLGRFAGVVVLSVYSAAGAMGQLFFAATALGRLAGAAAQSPLPAAGAPGRWRPGLLFA
jgi:hypothetical protein